MPLPSFPAFTLKFNSGFVLLLEPGFPDRRWAFTISSGDLKRNGLNHNGAISCLRWDLKQIGRARGASSTFQRFDFFSEKKKQTSICSTYKTWKDGVKNVWLETSKKFWKPKNTDAETNALARNVGRGKSEKREFLHRAVFLNTAFV